MRRALVVADVCGISLAFYLATQLFPEALSHDRVTPLGESLLFLLTLPLWVVLAKLDGLYDGDEECVDYSTADELIGVFHVVTIGTFLIIVAGWLSGRSDPTPPKLLTFWFLAIVAVAIARAICRTAVRRAPGYVQRTVVFGAGEIGQRVAKKVLQHPEYRIELLGFIDDDPRELRRGLDYLPVLGGVDQVVNIIRVHSVDRVIVAFTKDTHEVTLDLLRVLGDLNVHVDVVPRLFEVIGPKVRAHSVEGLSLTAIPRLRLSRSARLTKRLLDLAVSTIALILLTPLGALIAVAIKLDSHGPVFYQQVRMGAGGRPFRIYKFRTMVANADARKHELMALNKHATPGGDPRMFKIENDPRVTRIGAWLRRYSLDELPQILNVVRGEMSLVGPRPLILEEDRHVVDWRRCRLRVKPGVTGTWQVLGRDDIPFEEMTALDYTYVMTWSLLSDFQLILRTLPVVARSRST